MTDEPLTQQTLEMLEALEMLKSRFMARICRKSWTTSERKGGNKLRRVEIGSDLPAVPKKIPFLELIAAGVTPVLQVRVVWGYEPWKWSVQIQTPVKKADHWESIWRTVESFDNQKRCEEWLQRFTDEQWKIPSSKEVCSKP